MLLAKKVRAVVVVVPFVYIFRILVLMKHVLLGHKRGIYLH
jgi:hypothetical protein